MTTTREKLAEYLERHDLAEVLESSVLGYTKHFDALEAIVAEARDEAIEECMAVVAGQEWLPRLNPTQAFERVALAAVLQSLKTKAGKP